MRVDLYFSSPWHALRNFLKKILVIKSDYLIDERRILGE